MATAIVGAPPRMEWQVAEKDSPQDSAERRREVRIGCFGILALVFIFVIVIGIAEECGPTNKVCKVTYNDNTVATYECRNVVVEKNYIVVRTKDGDVNIPMSCVKMFTTKEGVAR